MSALPPNKTRGNHIAIPHLLLQAFDDPISTWRSVASNDPSDSLYPWNLVQNQENVVLLLTEKGGHVGWPIGWCPNSWKYMNDYIAAGFVNAYQDTRKSNFAHAHKRSPKMRNETYVNSKSKNKNTNISVADELLHRPLALRNTSLRYMLSFSKKRQSIIGSCRGVSKNDHG